MSVRGGSSATNADPADALEWLSLHEQTESELSAAEQDINERAMTQRQRRLTLKRISDAKENVQRLERALTKFEANPIKFKIGDGEIQRRKGLLAATRNTANRIDDLSQSSDRSRGGGWRKRTAIEETGETAAMSNNQLHAQQKQQIAVQDEKLDNILNGVQTLKVMSQDINQELDLQHHLLNDLDAAVDHTDRKIQQNTKKIDQIENKESGGWIPLIIMIILLGLIIMLFATDYLCPVFLFKLSCNRDSPAGNSSASVTESLSPTLTPISWESYTSSAQSVEAQSTLDMMTRFKRLFS